MKNKTKKRVGIVAMMLVLILAIGATAGTTLAKYISSVTVSSQTATVAQWGYTLTVNADKMFGEKYGDVSNQLAKVSDNNTVVASGTSGKEVVAPGTTGQMTVTVNGTAEVNAILSLTIDTDAYKSVVLTDGEDVEYYPINWYVGGVKVNEDNETAVTTADFANAIGKVLADVDGVKVAVDEDEVLVFLPANTSLNGIDLSISWDWAFGEADFEMSGNDAEDTLLGLISYGATYEELPANIVNWLIEKYATDEQAEVATKQAAVEEKATEVATKQATVDEAKAEVAAKQADLAEAIQTLEDLKLALERIKELDPTMESPEYAAAEAAVTEAETALGNEGDETEGTAYGDLYVAQEALTEAEGELETAQEALTEAEGELEEAEAAVVTAAQAGYAALQSNSEIEVAYSLAAVVVQTQLTDVEFAVKYGSNIVEATPNEP